MAQLFISYRSSDGRDKATALARDLGALYGDEQVFLDKDDLRAGVRWRDEIAATLKQRPVLLLLLTPQLLGARDDGGGLRIDDPADPVRREVAEALAGGAHLIPLLCDGVTAPPLAAELPAPFNRIGDFTWRPLRAYDWQHDVRRLAEDLQALGMAPAGPAARLPPAVSPVPRWWRFPAMAVAVALALGGIWYVQRSPSPIQQQSPPTATAAADKASAADVSGDWLATLGPDEKLSLSLRQTGEQLVLNSRPVVITERPDWSAYRNFWRERFGSELEAVSYRGKGGATALPGDDLVIDVALQIVSRPGDEPVDTGNLHATLAPDGATMAGTVWLNSQQKERRVSLARVPR